MAEGEIILGSGSQGEQFVRVAGPDGTYLEVRHPHDVVDLGAVGVGSAAVELYWDRILDEYFLVNAEGAESVSANPGEYLKKLGIGPYLETCNQSRLDEIKTSVTVRLNGLEQKIRFLKERNIQIDVDEEIMPILEDIRSTYLGICPEKAVANFNERSRDLVALAQTEPGSVSGQTQVAERKNENE